MLSLTADRSLVALVVSRWCWSRSPVDEGERRDGGKREMEESVAGDFVGER